MGENLLAKHLGCVKKSQRDKNLLDVLRDGEGIPTRDIQNVVS